MTPPNRPENREQADIDAAWDEVVALHPIHPWDHVLRAAWVKRHRSELDAACDRHRDARLEREQAK